MTTSTPDPDFIYFPPPSESMKPECVYHTLGLPDNRLYLHVCVDREQAQAGRGHNVERRFLKPYSPTLWAACEKFVIWRRAQLDAIGDAYRNLPNQMNLFGE